MKRKPLIISLFVLALTGQVYAHPPFTVDVACDKASSTVAATIMHPVSNPARHYIFKVEISVNGKLFKEEKFDHQQDNEQQKVSVQIPDLKSGDAVTVVGYCNLSGNFGNTIKVE